MLRALTWVARAAKSSCSCCQVLRTSTLGIAHCIARSVWIGLPLIRLSSLAYSIGGSVSCPLSSVHRSTSSGRSCDGSSMACTSSQASTRRIGRCRPAVSTLTPLQYFTSW